MGLKVFDENQTKNGYSKGHTDDNVIKDGHFTELNNIFEETNIFIIANLEAYKQGLPSLYDDNEAIKEANVVMKIKDKQDLNKEESAFLDENNSRFIGHNDVKNMTPRETFILFLNQYFNWSDIKRDEREEVGAYYTDLWSDYINFCVKNKVTFRNRFGLKQMKDYLLAQKFIGIRRRKMNGRDRHVFINFPALKDGVKMPSYMFKTK